MAGKAPKPVPCPSSALAAPGSDSSSCSVYLPPAVANLFMRSFRQLAAYLDVRFPWRLRLATPAAPNAPHSPAPRPCLSRTHTS